MSLSATGEISLAGSTAGRSVSLEIYGTTTSTVSLNDSLIRTLANKPSGTISLSDCRGAVIIYDGTSSPGIYGYVSTGSYPFGGIASAGVGTTGYTCDEFFDSGGTAILAIYAGTNLGVSWLNYAQVGGTIKYGSGVSSFAYIGGTNYWTWPSGSAWGFTGSGSPIGCKIVPN